ncbi:uncharacterized protein TNCT_686661 [Trichonephila clavata]|uniref:CUB domain-containing protein n=1 Tax=Trichonephila clavata TaxID=2740835 RepID=A0A8X6EYZ0_TRICU|nr:uncharacterized protein TNCT_686661 [Trichonephila clavata]
MGDPTSSKATADIALWVAGAHKPTHHDKVEIPAAFWIMIMLLTYTIDQVTSYITSFLDDFPSNSNDRFIRIGSDENSSLILKGFKKSTKMQLKNISFFLNVEAEKYDGIVISITYIDVRNGCRGNEYLKFSSQNKYYILCSKDIMPTIPDSRHTLGSKHYFYQKSVTISYFTKWSVTTRFEVTITAFKRSPCNDSTFKCKNSLCVWVGFLCDKRNNCGDASDEHSELTASNCEVHSPAEMTNFIPLFITLPLALLSITLVLYCCVRRQPNESQKEAGNVLYIYHEDRPRTVEMEMNDEADPIAMSEQEPKESESDDETYTLKSLMLSSLDSAIPDAKITDVNTNNCEEQKIVKY